jgi:hypothetical protein
MDGKFFGLGFYGSSDIFRFCLVKRWTWVFGVPLKIWACFGSSSSHVDHPITLGLVQRYDLYIAKVLSENRSCIEARAWGKIPAMGNMWMPGWWFGTWILFFHSVGNNHHPNWRNPSFFREVGWNHQPDIKIINHQHPIFMISPWLTNSYFSEG